MGLSDLHDEMQLSDGRCVCTFLVHSQGLPASFPSPDATRTQRVLTLKQVMNTTMVSGPGSPSPPLALNDDAESLGVVRRGQEPYATGLAPMCARDSPGQETEKQTIDLKQKMGPKNIVGDSAGSHDDMEFVRSDLGVEDNADLVDATVAADVTRGPFVDSSVVHC